MNWYYASFPVSVRIGSSHDHRISGGMKAIIHINHMVKSGLQAVTFIHTHTQTGADHPSILTSVGISIIKSMQADLNNVFVIYTNPSTFPH